MVNMSDDRHSVPKDFDSLEQWAESNKMKHSMDKYKFLSLGPQNFAARVQDGVGVL